MAAAASDYCIAQTLASQYATMLSYFVVLQHCQREHDA
jgi:hypothetical protein